MSGVSNPPRVMIPFAAGAASPAYITLPIPVPSQQAILPGAASYTDGFPPLTMSDPETQGGIPPFGQDMNGVLYTLSAFCAMLQAGQLCPFDSTAAAQWVGYKVGAKVASATTSGRVWTNYLDGNTVDPDVTPTNWAASDPLTSAIAPAAGTFNDVVLPGASDFAIDVDTALGNVTHTGFIARRNGQRLFISNIGVNLYTLGALTGSAANNQIRIPTDVALVQNQTAALVWVSTINKWLLI